MRLEILWLDRFPEMIRFFDRHPGAPVIAHLASTRGIEMGERNREPAILDSIDENVQQNRRRRVAKFNVRISDYDQVIGEIESQPIVSAAELGMNNSPAKQVGPGRELAADHDPAFHRRDEQSPIKTRADNAEQRFPGAGDIVQHAMRLLRVHWREREQRNSKSSG